MTFKKKFAVRSLLIATTLVALLLAWISRPLALYRAEQQAISKILDAGGTVRKDRVSLGKRKPNPGGFKLLRKEAHWTAAFLGVDIFARAQRVDSGPTANDEAFHEIYKLSGVAYVALASPHVTDATVERLTTLPLLSTLALNGVRFSPELLARLSEQCPDLDSFFFTQDNATADYLQHLPSKRAIQNLILNGKACDDQSMKQLGNVGPIKTLVIAEASITDQGLEHLASQPSLQALFLNDLNAGANGLSMLGEMPELQMLDLRNSQTNDTAIPWICGLKNLRTLRLDSTGITDDGLRQLSAGELPNLSHLTLTISDKLTRAVIRQVQEAYPGCEILCHEQGFPMFFEFNQSRVQ